MDSTFQESHLLAVKGSLDGGQGSERTVMALSVDMAWRRAQTERSRAQVERTRARRERAEREPKSARRTRASY